MKKILDIFSSVVLIPLGSKLFIILTLGVLVALMESFKLVSLYSLFSVLGFEIDKNSIDIIVNTFNYLGLSFSYEALLWVTILTFVLSLVMSTCFDYLQINLSQKYILVEREKINSKLRKVNYKFFETIDSGKFVSLLNYEIAKVGNIQKIVLQIIANGLVILFYLSSSFYLSPISSSILLVISFFIVIAYNFTFDFVRKRSELLNKTIREFTLFLFEFFSGIKTLKSMKLEDQFLDKINRYNRKLSMDTKKLELYPSFINKFLGTFSILILIVSIITMGNYIPSEKSYLILVLIYFYRSYSLLSSTSSLYTNFISSIPIYDFVESYKEELKFVEEKKSKELEVCFDDSISIKANNISFGYGTKKILNNLSFSLGKNEMLVIYGESGVGKSTLVELLLGFREYEGELLVQNQNLCDLDLEKYRESISYISQVPFVFSDTIENNISLLNSSYRTEDILDACKKSDSLDFINNKNEGLQYVLGERGEGLSGGQKQRLSLARALLRKPSLYLFDEPTSALDEKTKMKIVKTIKDLKGTATIIIVTHDRNIFNFADRYLDMSSI